MALTLKFVDISPVGSFCIICNIVTTLIFSYRMVRDYKRAVTTNIVPVDVIGKAISNSYTIGCPPARGDNPRALASGLSYVQVDKHGITILYHLH